MRKEEQCSTDRLGEFDRFRTCDHQSHNLALYQLSYKLYITCSRWIRTITSRTGIWYATITPWSDFLVAPEGVEPSPTEPKPVVLPLYYRAVSCSGGRTRTYEVKKTADLQSALVAAGALPIVVASDGFEPPLAESGSAVLTITPWSNVAETKGFEPLRRCRLPVFRTGAINLLCQISCW